MLVGELAQRGDWIVANVETNSFWPVNAQKQIYRGETIWILPITHKHFPAIAMKARPGLDRANCERLLMRFLSTLSWVTEHGMSVDGIGGGNLPRPMGRDRTFGFSITEEFDLSYFPEPKNEKALLALALMREGRGLNHPGYNLDGARPTRAAAGVSGLAVVDIASVIVSRTSEGPNTTVLCTLVRSRNDPILLV